MSRSGRTTIQGQYGDSLKIVSVDENGNIVGVLKGDYLGSLKTLATDDEGRILAKIYDPQDIYGGNNTIGLAELAARMGSIVKNDRRGQVVWMDGFESALLKWTESGGGGSANIVQTPVHTGDNALELTGNALTFYNVTKIESFSGDSRTGIELAFSVPPTFLDGLITFGFIRYVDFGTSYYSRCLYQGTEYDLSPYKLHYSLSAEPKRTEFLISVSGEASQANTVYFDDVIFTVQEP
jgi:hypothetical protein